MARAQLPPNSATSLYSNTYARRTVLGACEFAKTLTKTTTSTYSRTQFETNVQASKRTNNLFLNRSSKKNINIHTSRKQTKRRARTTSNETSPVSKKHTHAFHFQTNFAVHVRNTRCFSRAQFSHRLHRTEPKLGQP